LDFAIVVAAFGVLSGVVNSFSVLTAQFFGPYGYSDDTSGFFGATLLLVGIVAAVVTAPLFDRVLTHHLAWTCKVLCPILAIFWLSLIWAVKPHNTAGLYAIMAIIGATSLIMLPVALELGVELTRNADGSSAIMWFISNLFAIIFISVEGALRASESASPPKNMRRALIFQGSFLCAIVSSVVLIKGKQRRRELDEMRAKEALGLSHSDGAMGLSDMKK